MSRATNPPSDAAADAAWSMQTPGGDWLGRTVLSSDSIGPQPLERLAALLNYAAPPWPMGEVPPLAHWLYFLPQTRQSGLGLDGHPEHDPLIPSQALPRRMWGAGRVRFLSRLSTEIEAARRSTVHDVREKHGSIGRLLIVTLRHDVLVGDDLVLSEEQQLVYRQARSEAPEVAAAAPAALCPPAVGANAVRELSLDPVQLFRFSALTFNSHRIHYDRPYAVDVEGYRGLVVHGPLLATLLMRHYLDQRGGAVAEFAFRAQRPVFDFEPITLNLADTEDGADLWIAGGDGATCMTAQLRRA